MASVSGRSGIVAAFGQGRDADDAGTGCFEIAFQVRERPAETDMIVDQDIAAIDRDGAVEPGRRQQPLECGRTGMPDLVRLDDLPRFGGNAEPV